MVNSRAGQRFELRRRAHAHGMQAVSRCRSSSPVNFVVSRPNRGRRLPRARFRCAVAAATAATACSACALLRRHRHDFELQHGLGLLPVAGAQAIRAGIAAADDHDALAGRQNLIRNRRRPRCACSAAAETPSRSECPSVRARAHSDRADFPRRPRAKSRQTPCANPAPVRCRRRARSSGKHALRRHLLQPPVEHMSFPS